MINKIEFSARNLTSKADLFLLLENARKNGVFDLIDNDLVFENESTNKIKMNHIKTAYELNLQSKLNRRYGRKPHVTNYSGERYEKGADQK